MNIEKLVRKNPETMRLVEMNALDYAKVLIVCGSNGYKKVFKKLTKHGIEIPEVGCESGRTLQRENIKIRIMYVKDRNDFATAAHEAIHVVHFIFDHLGIYSGGENTEGVAYAVDCIVHEYELLMKENGY